MNNMTAVEVIEELRSLGKESIKKVLLKHGAQEPFFGVKIEDLKKIRKRLGTSHELALELYESGISDAMYLAGMLVDDRRITKQELQRWIKRADWSLISEYTVPSVAAESSHGVVLARQWITSRQESIAAAGWCTWSFLVAIKPDDELDLPELKGFLKDIEQTIHQRPDRVRLAMNNFVISVGSYVSSLTVLAIKAAEKIGTVTVNMGETACKVPDAVAYIHKVEERGTLGKKRKTARC